MMYKQEIKNAGNNILNGFTIGILAIAGLVACQIKKTAECVENVANKIIEEKK